MGIKVEDILKKIPRPNYDEFPDLYEELDNMTRQIAGLLSPLTEGDLLRFDRASPEDLFTILSKAPDIAVPFFMMLCGFSERELERLYNLKNIYAARREEVLRRFAEVVARHLRHPLHLETALYKFYKNWEEHQKRHRRGRMAERAITEALERAGIAAGKVKVKCGGREREIDLAVPPDPNRPKVAIMVRHGVFRDLVKRAKEYSTEMDELLQCYPDLKFVVVYLVPPHERERLAEIRARIEGERAGKKPYELVVLTQEDIGLLIERLKEWLG